MVLGLLICVICYNSKNEYTLRIHLRSPEKQTQEDGYIHKESHYEELAHAIMEAGKSQAGDPTKLVE